jgi:hypothetical protein
MSAVEASCTGRRSHSAVAALPSHFDALMIILDTKMPGVRTTIRIDEALYRRAKARAAQTGRTVSEVIEDAVREALRPARRRDTGIGELPTFGNAGLVPGVDLASNSAVRDAMEAGEPLDAMR